MSAKYSAIAAKLKAMYANALSKEDFVALSEKKSVGEICGYLKNSEGYGDALEALDASDVHRGQIEFLMEEKILLDILKIFNFTDNAYNEVMDFIFARREIEFLKRQINHIYTHQKRSEDKMSYARFNAFFNSHTKIDREIMENAASLEDCIEACRNTRYAEPLRRAMKAGADYFSVAMLLDSYYYKSFWKTVNTRLPQSERGGFLKILGSNIDMLNIMWIYRGKKFFDFENEIIFTYLIPVRYRLGEDTLKALVNADGVDAFLREVSNTPYSELFNSIDKFPEESHRRIEERIAKSVFTMNTQSLSAIYAYVKLKRSEIRKITTVIEGVRYGMSPDWIRAHIEI